MHFSISFIREHIKKKLHITNGWMDGYVMFVWGRSNLSLLTRAMHENFETHIATRSEKNRAFSVVKRK